jgi:hypothetical protein
VASRHRPGPSATKNLTPTARWPDEKCTAYPTIRPACTWSFARRRAG